MYKKYSKQYGGVNTPTQPAPSGLQAAFSGLRLTPSGVQVVPSELQPAPSGLQAAPSGLQSQLNRLHPAYSGLQPAPSGLQVAPSGLQAAFGEIQSEPSGLQAEPIGSNTGPLPAPSGLYPTHSGLQAEPIGSNAGPLPAPSGLYPTHSGLQPTHSGLQPTYSGLQPTHSGLQPAPGGLDRTYTYNPAPAGLHHAFNELTYGMNTLIKLDSNQSIFKQLYSHFKKNPALLDNHYWKKTDAGMGRFQNAITLRFEFFSQGKRDVGVDYGGIQGRVFSKIKDELTTLGEDLSLRIFSCEKTEDFICVGDDDKKLPIKYEYCYFLGQLFALFYYNDFKVGWALNPFLAYYLLFDEELDDDNLKSIIEYCYKIAKTSGLFMYSKRHEKLFEMLNSEYDDDEFTNNLLSNFGVMMNYADIIRLEYFENPRNLTFMHHMKLGFKSIAVPELKKVQFSDKNKNIETIDKFIKTLYGEFVVDTDKILDNIIIQGEFDNTTKSKEIILRKIRQYLDDSETQNEKIERARKIFAKFFGNSSITYDRKLEIEIKNVFGLADIEEHTCAGSVCFRQNAVAEELVDRFIDDINNFDINERMNMAGGRRNYKNKYIKYVQKMKL
jgi:hypothetical protein